MKSEKLHKIDELLVIDSKPEYKTHDLKKFFFASSIEMALI